MSFDKKVVDSMNSEKIWFFRFKKFDDSTYIITNDAGKFQFLSIDAFEKFIAWDIEKLAEYDELAQKGFIKDAE